MDLERIPLRRVGKLHLGKASGGVFINLCWFSIGPYGVFQGWCRVYGLDYSTRVWSGLIESFMGLQRFSTRSNRVEYTTTWRTYDAILSL